MSRGSTRARARLKRHDLGRARVHDSVNERRKLRQRVTLLGEIGVAIVNAFDAADRVTKHALANDRSRRRRGTSSCGRFVANHARSSPACLSAAWRRRPPCSRRSRRTDLFRRGRGRREDWSRAAVGSDDGEGHLGQRQGAAGVLLARLLGDGPHASLGRCRPTSSRPTLRDAAQSRGISLG